VPARDPKAGKATVQDRCEEPKSLKLPDLKFDLSEIEDVVQI